MKLTPIGPRVIIRIQEKNVHMAGEKKIHLSTTDTALTKFYVEAIGPEVSKETHPISVGDEVRLYSNAHMCIHSEDNTKGIVHVTDITAIIKR
jgi:co-chaperonin GroES (HSP10)